MSMELKLRLDWSELDVFGHINNVSYFKYIQASRVNYWEEMGLTLPNAGSGIGPMLASTTCQFRKPLFYPGSIIIKASMQFVKNSSFGLLHHILNEHGELAAEANDVVVLYDFSKNEKVTVPDELRRKIEVLEGRPL